MTVRRTISEYNGIYFITFTCCNWLPLFDEANGYSVVYKWFDHLKKNGHYILGYVIMPNHVHCLLAFRNTQCETINRIVGNGKRFMVYELVNLLQDAGKDDLLTKLKSLIKKNEKERGKLHQVFEPSFDWKECTSEKFIIQKLRYIHENPCRGKWNLVLQPEDYDHSSARYYLTGTQGVYDVMSYSKLDDIDLTVPKLDQ
jgi:REP element-mobilizing transposase RayT